MFIKFPKLYGLSSKGQVKEWEIRVEGTNESARIITEHGQEKGKRQTATVKVTKGKNLGKRNETTAFQQAESEAKSKWLRKKDKKYVEVKADLFSFKADHVLPMLAHDFKKRGNDIQFPAIVQPKLNGIRCLARKESGSVRFTSRGGKEFVTLEHLAKALRPFMSDRDILDGELFTKDLTFQQITSAIKRSESIDSTSQIEYWIYDMIRYESYDKRNKHLTGLLANIGEAPIVLCPSFMVSSEKAMMKYHRRFVSEGFEGTIVRNLAGLYKKDYRSVDLQKYKDFQDDEFKIVDATEGVGSAAGTVTWVCEDKQGQRFRVRPRGTMVQRKLWWTNRSKYMGKVLTVRYQVLSDAGIPIFPVGIAIRDYE